MTFYTSKPKIADGVVLGLSVCMIGAPHVLGPYLTDWVSYILFYGGILGLVCVFIRWVLWLFLPKSEVGVGFDNRGGNYVGRDNSAPQTIFHGPVTINHPPPPHPARPAPPRPKPIRKPRVAVRDYTKPNLARRTLHGPEAAPQQSSPDTLVADAPIWKAIEYVGSKIGDAEQFYTQTRNEIRQAALDGKITIRGRHQIDTGEQKTVFSKVHSDIPPDYWKNSEINVLATHEQHETWDHIDPETARAWGPDGVLAKKRYAELRVNMNQIKSEWPF
jgi:hypothetical protein